MPAALHSPPLLVTDHPDRDDVQFIEDRVDEFNMGQTGIFDARLLSIMMRDHTGEVVAGIFGWTWGGTCEIRTLWVHERLRGSGVGRRLMLGAEGEARRRGADQIVLSTHSFQAPEFYRRLGFERVGQVNDHPRGHQSIYLRKRLHEPPIISP